MADEVEKYLWRVPLPFDVHPSEADKALVVVETRPLQSLARVIATAVRTHPGWHLYVFGTPEVHAMVQAACMDYTKVTRVSLRSGMMTTHDYSRLLMSPGFWDIIKQEHVLIFQNDCVLFRTCPAKYFAYDYVGAVCGVMDPDLFVMNGGLSLRRRSAMVQAVKLLHDHHPELLDQPEDVAFCGVMRQYPFFTLPSMEQCNRFAIESVGNPYTVIGMHGIDKGYAPAKLVSQCLACLP